MANKRILKKSVDDLGNAIIDEMAIAFYNMEGADKDLISKAISKVLEAMNDAHSRISRVFGEKRRDFATEKEYLTAKKAFIKNNYDELITDFNEQLKEALKDFTDATPEAEKEKNKKLAAQ